MKRLLLFVVVMIMIFALAGCNVAPNVPGVTPYTTPGTYNTVPGTNGNYLGRGAYGTYRNYTGRGAYYGNNVGGTYGNNAGRGTVGKTTGRGTVGNNMTGRNLPANGRNAAANYPAQFYGTR
jgi:hypothetical protein